MSPHDDYDRLGYSKSLINNFNVENKYGHPNKETLENLKESKIYKTDIDGSVILKIKNDKLLIETCKP